jgi:hypothetical protein
MKKVYMIGMFSFAAVAVNAQRVSNEYAPRVSEVKSEHKAKPTNQQVEKVIIWSDEFTTPANWTIANIGTNDEEWHFSNDPTLGETVTALPAALVPFASATAGNGFLLVNSDGNNTSDNDGTQIITTATTATPINLSGYPNVLLTYQHSFRWYKDTRGVRVSADNGVTWTEFEMSNFTDYTTPNQNSGNPEITTIDISAIAGNQSQVLVQFYYDDNDIWGWYWAVDDVSIIEKPLNDVQNIGVYFSGTNNEGLEYGRTPVDQLDASYEVGGSIVNFGVNAQTNVNVVADFVSFSSNYAVGTVAPGDTIGYNSTETPSLALGTYNGTYTAVSTEETSGSNFPNNIGLRSFAVTDNMYSQDGIGVYPPATLVTGAIGSESFSEPVDTYLASMYHLKGVTNLISGFEIGLSASSVAGAELQISIMDTSSFFADGLAVVNDLNGNEAKSGYYTLSASEISAGKIGVAFSQPISLAAGAYFAVVQVINTGTTPIYVLDDQTVTQPSYASMVNTLSDLGVATAYTNGNAFAIRLKMGDQASVNEIEGLTAVSVYPNPATSSTNVAIELNTESIVSVSVTDLSGKVVYSTDLGSVNGVQNVAINTDSISNGAYLVNVNVNGSTSIQKLIVRK